MGTAGLSLTADAGAVSSLHTYNPRREHPSGFPWKPTHPHSPREIPGQEEFGGATRAVKEGGEDSVEMETGLSTTGRGSNMTSPWRMLEMSLELR